MSICYNLRQNTGYDDDKWALVSGHQEVGESAIRAMIREAKEEIDIEIESKDLQIIHTTCRRTTRETIDIFLRCTKWQGNIKNQEPKKCGGLKFYSLDTLPSNVADYVKEEDILSHL